MTHIDEVLVTTYITESTSKQSVEVNKVILNETKNTRRTLHSTAVKIPENPDATTRIVILIKLRGCSQTKI